MWVLVGDSEGCREFSIWLQPSRSYTIGRKDADLVLGTDKSVSRSHATLTVAEPVSTEELMNVDARCRVTLSDKGSKFGTYLNGMARKVVGSEQVREGDVITFGVNKSTFRLTYVPVVICCSGMRTKQRLEINEGARRFDLRSLKDWTPSCTHLVMLSLRVTMKVVLALANGRHIVTPEWIQAFGSIDPINFRMPEPEKFLPPIIEDSINLVPSHFTPRQDRAKVLTGCQFIVFSDADLASLEKVIEGAGGTLTRWELPDSGAQTVSIAEKLRKLSDPCVIQPASPSPSQWAHLQRALSQMGLRAIQQDDVAKAILFVDREQYCNPSGAAGPELSSEANDESMEKEKEIAPFMPVEPVAAAPTTNEPSRVTEPSNSPHPSCHPPKKVDSTTSSTYLWVTTNHSHSQPRRHQRQKLLI
ncbi:hypothetical protein DFJ77DRAFT_144301 [Powellomyces hirtus]|nr:hypothetical protein DFJ77DRAFT_144301 [Powellomyces hirtus]